MNHAERLSDRVLEHVPYTSTDNYDGDTVRSLNVRSKSTMVSVKRTGEKPTSILK